MNIVTSAATPPGPLVHPEAAQFWEDVTRGDFALQRCTTCATVRFPPAPICWKCLSTGFEQSRVSPSGTLVTSIVVHRTPPGSPFSSIVPYRSGLFVLENGIRVPGRVVCECHEDIALGTELVMCRLTSVNDYDVYGFAHTCVLGQSQ